MNVNPAAIGIMAEPMALYIFGIKLDRLDKISENKSHDQQLLKYLIAVSMFTGTKLRNIENPAMPPTATAMAIASGATALAPKGT